MTIITPEERAAFRATYMRSLATALVENDARRWLYASDEERVEVRKMLASIGLLFPDDGQQMLNEARRMKAESKSAAKQAKAAAIELAKAAAPGAEVTPT